MNTATKTNGTGCIVTYPSMRVALERNDPFQCPPNESINHTQDPAEGLSALGTFRERANVERSFDKTFSAIDVSREAYGIFPGDEDLIDTDRARWGHD